MRAKIKTTALVMAMLTATASLGACSERGGSSVKIDDTKSQLYVAYYNGGLGEEWFDAAVKDFETLYANYEFEPGTGKKGVQVIPTKDKGLHGNTIGTTVLSRSEDVFLIEDVDYYDYYNYGNMYDITDVVTGKASDSETKTIEEKLKGGRDSYWNMGTQESPKYYALPYHASTMNLIYNVDLFEEMGYYFGIDEDGKSLTAEGMSEEDLDNNLQNLFVADGTDTSQRSAGPDGEFGTEDDGLPATYADFFALCKMMRLDGVTPIMWNGYAPIYLVDLANELWANNVGKEQFELNWKLEGEATDLLVPDGDGFATTENGAYQTISETITADNAYDLHLQKGKLQAIEFIKELLSDSTNYYAKGFDSSFSHTEAQKNFIKGGYETGYGKAGMLVEGTWWNREGRSNYDTAGKNQYKDRKFAVMPLPKADSSQIGEKNTKLITTMSAMFISGDCSATTLPIAKAFLRYLHTDEALNTFTSYTDIMREFDYELTQESLDRMSYFGKSVYEMYNGKNKDNYDIIETNPLSATGIKNSSLINYRNWGFKNPDGTSNPFLVYSTNSTKNKSAAKYVLEIYNGYKTQWKTLIKK